MGSLIEDSEVEDELSGDGLKKVLNAGLSLSIRAPLGNLGRDVCLQRTVRNS